MHTKKTIQHNVIHKKNIHTGKTEERRRWLAQMQVELIYVGVGFSFNRIINSLQIVIKFWMEEFFFELYFSAKRQCINLFFKHINGRPRFSHFT